jgi:ribosomal protein S18 acetylase RimI-like enzyme
VNAPEAGSGPADYHIEPAALGDLRAVYRLERVIFPLDAYSYFDLMLLLFWPGTVVLKYVAPDGALAGFAAGAPPRHDRYGWIITLGISPDHQRRGLGRRLLAACESQLDAACIRLTVRASNMPAIRLYEATGYQFVTRRPGYYRDGEAGLIMEKCLDDEPDQDR